MGAGHSAEGGAYASDPPAHSRRKKHSKRRRHSVDSVASYSSQNHVDRIRTQNFSAASCQDEGDFGSIKTCLFRRSSSNLEFPLKRPESVTSNTSSTRSRLRELVERKSNQDELKSAADTVGDIQYFGNPTETLEFDQRQNSLESKNSQDDRPKKRKLSKAKNKAKDPCDSKNKQQDQYQSKLAEYYQVPVQLPQDEFYKHLTRSRAAEELLQKRISNSDKEFGSYGRLCKHKEVEGSNLRRSRSLAVIREETFTDLQIQNHAKSKRSQLIPRARLFDKPCFKDRLPGRAKYHTKEDVLDGIYIESTASCFAEINRQKTDDKENTENRSDTEDISSRNGSQPRSVNGSWPNLNEEIKQTNASEGSIGNSRNPSEIDSLDSNYVRKHYNFEANRNNCKINTPESERSNVSPETGIVKIENQDSDSEEVNSFKNNTPKSFTNDSLSVSPRNQDKKESKEVGDNDSDSYDEISLTREQSEEKNVLDNDAISKAHQVEKAEDSQSTGSENDGSLSSPSDSISSYISISIGSSTDKSHKLEYLANSLAEKIDEYCESQYKENVSVTSQTLHSENNTESEPIYSKIGRNNTFADIKRKTSISENSNLYDTTNKHSDVYISNTCIEYDNYSLKSNNNSSKNITTEPFVTTLIENQYYSLPDINISKCLRKSERIDAQLREEDTEDIPCENTYEVAQTHFREILCNKGYDNYGPLNKTQITDKGFQQIGTKIHVPKNKEPQIIHCFSKLEDDLKSIITIESSNGDDKDLSYFHSDAHQNEREINEIEGTIRNNKVITKSESLKLNSSSIYRPHIKLPKSYSNDNIDKFIPDKKLRTGVRKHYSLRQRDPLDDEINRMPSPNTVEKKQYRKIATVKPSKNEIVTPSSLISRVQSFKISAESNVDIVPLSGHQTIVINPTHNRDLEETKQINKDISSKEKQFEVNFKRSPDTISNSKLTFDIKPPTSSIVKKKAIVKSKNIKNSIESSNSCTPKDSFINIKLNKVVKTTIPKLKEGTTDKIASVQYKFEKPPPRLIIKETQNSLKPTNSTSTRVDKSMSRPQILQVLDSKNRKQNTTSTMDTKANMHTFSDGLKIEEKSNLIESKVIFDNAKEKLNNAIKIDMEYQEKLHSVKNYWSKLIDKSQENPELKAKENNTTDDESGINNNNNISHEDNDTEKDDNNSLPDISVGNIIKSLETAKVVDSIRKICSTKLQLWKDESEKVKSDSEIEETPVKKIIKNSEGNIYDTPKPEKITKKADFECRDTPEIEIVELSSNDGENQKTQATLIKAKGFDEGGEEFDHVRYKVMKSELFKNSMIANYRKEAQFDGLLQYLQDYSFQELLVNNNIVIIEPVRTKIEPAPKKTNINTDTCKISQPLLKKNDISSKNTEKPKNSVHRHFFYHPIRVNKEIIEEELPNPDTVKKVRNLFEDTLKMRSPMTQDPPLINESIGLTRRATSDRNLSEDSKANKIGGRKKVLRQLTIDTNLGNKKWDNASLSSGVSSGDLSSNNEYETDALSSYSQKLKDNAYSSSDEYLCDSVSQDFCCESQYVSPDIMKKIRECGTSVTYYGGKVLNSKTNASVSPMTKAIMDEIKGLQKNCSRDCYSCQTKCRGDKCSCLVPEKHNKLRPETKQTSATSSDSGNHDCGKNNIRRTEVFPSFKFKLVKSNSCSSRLELTGTDESKNSKFKYRNQHSLTEDPPLVYEHENSVKNKIYRLESYSKGMAETPFENKDNGSRKVWQKPLSEGVDSKAKKNDNIIIQPASTVDAKNEENKEKTNVLLEREDSDSAHIDKLNSDGHSFEKKFYYVNENLEQSKVTPGKFGEMVFEEFEVLETCYDSLNSNKSLNNM